MIKFLHFIVRNYATSHEKNWCVLGESQYHRAMTVNMWNQRYGDEEYVYGREPNDFLRDEASRLPSKARVLCVGDGEGRNGVFLATLGHRVTSLDYSEEGLRKTRRLAEERGVSVTTLHADLADYRAESNSFDVVVSIFCHLPADIRHRFYADLARILAPGGLFLIEAYTPAQLALGTGGPKDPGMLCTLEGLRNELVGLEILSGRELERDVVEGKFHTGRAATVQVIARRNA